VTGFDPKGSSALAATSCSIVITDCERPDNPIVYANAAFSALSGYPLEEIIGRSCSFLHGPHTCAQARADIGAAIAARCGIRREILNYRKDGTHFWNDLTIDPIRNAAGLVTGFIGVQQLIHGADPENEDEPEQNLRLAHIAQHIHGYVYRRVMRIDGRIEMIYTSPSSRRLLGIEAGHMQQPFHDYVHPDDQAALSAAIRHSAAKMSIFREEFRLVDVAGVSHWMRSDAPPRRMANGDIVWDGVAIEIDAEKRWEREISHQAQSDPLTGLLTRAAWHEALEEHMKVSRRTGGSCAIICVDIAEFAALNHRLGQWIADDVLREAASRLASATAAAGGIGARLGGDEFALLIPQCTDETMLAALADAAGEALARPMLIAGKQIAIRCCVGATLHREPQPDDTDLADITDEIMKQAELALRWSKQSGPGTRILYSLQLDDRFRNQAVLARSLEQAIAGDELELHYQPLVDLASGRIVSAEALVRWKHPTLGIQRPDLFIPLAEAMGLIVPLGRWVLERAMRQSTRWRDAGLSPPPIAINVSGSQLVDPGFIALVEEALRSSGADASDFELELTEGLLIEPSPQVMASLHALRTLGFTITIDDFGSGHATFRYLRDFPIDKLKIDQIFVRKLVMGSTDALIIRAVVSLARSMGVAFVAEGIETEMQRDFLLREGCEIGQGYLFSMPLLEEDFGWMLANHALLPLRPGESGAQTDPPLESQAA